jgi:hypothetical protein
MAPSLGQLIVARCKRDKEFKRQTLTVLRTKLAKAIPRTAEWKRLDRAITTIDDMK